MLAVSFPLKGNIVGGGFKPALSSIPVALAYRQRAGTVANSTSRTRNIGKKA
jgi:hypothetical protein